MKVTVRGSSAILALSSRSYLAYMYQGRYFTSPLTYVPHAFHGVSFLVCVYVVAVSEERSQFRSWAVRW